MLYTITYAASKNNYPIMIGLDKSASLHVVTAFRSGEGKTIRKQPFSDNDCVKIVFYAWCEEFGIAKIEETNQICSARSFDKEGRTMGNLAIRMDDLRQQIQQVGEKCAEAYAKNHYKTFEKLDKRMMQLEDELHRLEDLDEAMHAIFTIRR